MDVNEMKLLIVKIRQAIDQNKLKEAKDYYLESSRAYPWLSVEDKKQVYGELRKIRDDLAK